MQTVLARETDAFVCLCLCVCVCACVVCVCVCVPIGVLLWPLRRHWLFILHPANTNSFLVFFASCQHRVSTYFDNFCESSWAGLEFKSVQILKDVTVGCALGDSLWAAHKFTSVQILREVTVGCTRGYFQVSYTFWRRGYGCGCFRVLLRPS